MSARKWSDLTRNQQRAVLGAAAAEGALKAVALVDLYRRPAGHVRGSKGRWTLAIALVNSCGLVPLAYFVKGRRPAA